MTAWTIIGWAATVGSVVSLSGAVAWMRLRSCRPADSSGFSPDALFDEGTDEGTDVGTNDAIGFTMERYRPMERLLSSEDFNFLQRMPGYTDKIGAHWKREQRRVFRLYLQELAGDFHRLHAAARAMVAESPAASSSVVGDLIGQQLNFWRAMAGVELRLIMPGAARGIDVRPLLQMLEAMREDLSRSAGVRSAA